MLVFTLLMAVFRLASSPLILPSVVLPLPSLFSTALRRRSSVVLILSLTTSIFPRPAPTMVLMASSFVPNVKFWLFNSVVRSRMLLFICAEMSEALLSMQRRSRRLWASITSFCLPMAVTMLLPWLSIFVLSSVKPFIRVVLICAMPVFVVFSRSVMAPVFLSISTLMSARPA